MNCTQDLFKIQQEEHQQGLNNMTINNMGTKVKHSLRIKQELEDLYVQINQMKEELYIYGEELKHDPSKYGLELDGSDPTEESFIW